MLMKKTKKVIYLGKEKIINEIFAIDLKIK